MVKILIIENIEKVICHNFIRVINKNLQLLFSRIDAIIDEIMIVIILTNIVLLRLNNTMNEYYSIATFVLKHFDYFLPLIIQ